MEENYKPERRFEAYLIASRFGGYRNVEMTLFKKVLKAEGRRFLERAGKVTRII